MERLEETRKLLTLRHKSAKYPIWKLLAVFLLVSCTALGLALLSFYSHKVSAQKPNSCIECHTKLEGRLGEPSKLFEHDIHNARGLSCNDCHGGDPTKDDMKEAKSPYSGYIGKPKPVDIPFFCGKCHADASVMKKFNPSLRVDQVQEYYTSVHGTRLKAGDQNVATCVSCHGIHGIRAPDDSQSTVYPRNVAETCSKCHANGELMGKYNIPHDQYEKYQNSVHHNALYEKNDLSAPTCNDCHGNHGAVPPGIASVANVCGQCHGRQSELFQKSPHKNAFDQMGAGECIRCHSNHGITPPTDAMLGVSQGSVCASCHNGDKGSAAAQQMRDKIDGLQFAINDTTDLLGRAERAGMEVSKPKFELKDAADALTQARVLVHTASVEELSNAVAPGMDIAANSYDAGAAAFSELGFRRKGLAVSLIFILFLASLVYLKIKQIERNGPGQAPAESGK